jgi:GNAT superfamily N-acetyltransferase
MHITYAGSADGEWLSSHHRHIPAEVILEKIARREILLSREAGSPVAWLSFNYFWDVIPFMTMLFVEETCRGHGHARALMEFWEQEMYTKGHQRVLTSTMSNEGAQHMYRHLGNRDCGALLLPNEPLEVILMKQIR